MAESKFLTYFLCSYFALSLGMPPTMEFFSISSISNSQARSGLAAGVSLGATLFLLIYKQRYAPLIVLLRKRESWNIPLKALHRYLAPYSRFRALSASVIPGKNCPYWELTGCFCNFGVVTFAGANVQIRPVRQGDRNLAEDIVRSGGGGIIA